MRNKTNARSDVKTKQQEPTRAKVNLREVFAGIDKIRKHAKPLPKGVTIKSLIEEGRM